MTFPGGTHGKESPGQCWRLKRPRFDLWVRKIPWSRKWHSTPEFLPVKFHGQGRLADYSPWGRRIGHTWAHTCQWLLMASVLFSVFVYVCMFLILLIKLKSSLICFQNRTKISRILYLSLHTWYGYAYKWFDNWTW